ncbi:vWA domain-containing protein [Clostridium culturomicium]|uniref:vWA domain-containing protein n=1 Tax=Clostridium culturomicium TaxID=1499683 RepID=UPI00058AD8EA|nr:vWA domain-containing protein [Clostridium culturomicium]
MKLINAKRIIQIISIILVVLLSNVIFSFNNEVKAESNKNNIIILLDNSGSMKSGIGDLAKVACSMALDCLDSEKVNIGMITFGEKVTVLNDISQSQDSLELKKIISEINFDEDYTNMKDGLKEAINQLRKVKGNKSILILSDGVETAEGGLAPNHREQMKALEEEAAGEEIKINSVALSDEVESEFLNSIAVKTGGTFRDGKTADKLFEAITSIIGLENDFITVGNFSTLEKKSEKIKISESIESGVISVAAADNVQPDIEVRINGKLLEPSIKGNLYEVYKFTNSSSSEVEITQKKDVNTSVIIQLKSKAKLNVLGDYQNYISLPINVPRNIHMNLDCGGSPVPEGAFIQRNGSNIQQGSEKGAFLDVFEGAKPGKEVVRYTAKDGNGGIIAIAELVVSINDYPPYDYKDVSNKDKFIREDIISIEIEPKGKDEVSELGGTLIIKRGEKHEEIPLVEKDGVFTAEFPAEAAGKLEYYAYIRGIRGTDNSSFEYKLETKTIEVLEKPIIKLGLKNGSKQEAVIDSSRELTFQIMPDSIIQEETEVFVLSDKLKELGSFKVNSETKEVKVKILLKDLTDNLVLRFKTSSGIDITESLDTNINVISKWMNFLDKYIKPILLVLIVLTIAAGLVAGIYFISIHAYKVNIKDNSKRHIEISYNFKPRGRGDSVGGELNEVVKKLNLNVDTRRSILTLDEDEMNTTLGKFKLENIYEGYPHWRQGLCCLLNRKNKPITISYIEYAVQDIYINENQVEDAKAIKEKDDVRIIYSINKINKLEIEFKL